MGVVIDNYDLKGDPLDSFCNGIQTVSQQIAGIEIYNYEADIRHLFVFITHLAQLGILGKFIDCVSHGQSEPLATI